MKYNTTVTTGNFSVFNEVIQKVSLGKVKEVTFTLEQIETLMNSVAEVSAAGKLTGPVSGSGATVEQAMNDCFGRMVNGDSYDSVNSYCTGTYGVSYTSLLFGSQIAMFSGFWWWFSTPANQVVSYFP